LKPVSPDWKVKRLEVARALTDAIGKDSVLPQTRRNLAHLMSRHDRPDFPAAMIMSLEEVLAMAPATIQRDTAKRWKKSAERLSKLLPIHKIAIITVDAAGEIQRVDCNTRCYGWENNLTDAKPDELLVIAIYCDNADKSNDVYKTCDSTAQGKTGQDQLFSAYSEVGLAPTSNYVRNCNGLVAPLREAFAFMAKHGQVNKSMLRRATETKNLRRRCQPELVECVRLFKRAIAALDSLDVSSSRFSGAATEAFLLAYMKYVVIAPDGAIPEAERKLLSLFADYRDDQGTKKAGKFDAAENINIIVKEEASGGAGERHRKTLLILGAVERYMEKGAKAVFSHCGLVDENVYLTSRTALTKGRAHRNKKGDGGVTVGVGDE